MYKLIIKMKNADVAGTIHSNVYEPCILQRGVVQLLNVILQLDAHMHFFF